MMDQGSPVKTNGLEPEYLPKLRRQPHHVRTSPLLEFEVFYFCCVGVWGKISYIPKFMVQASTSVSVRDIVYADSAKKQL